MWFDLYLLKKLQRHIAEFFHSTQLYTNILTTPDKHHLKYLYFSITEHKIRQLHKEKQPVFHGVQYNIKTTLNRQ